MVGHGVGLVVPTLNGAADLERLLAGLARQIRSPDRVLVIDSSSTDGTREVAEAHRVEVKVIDRCEFDHGRTRQLGVRALHDMDIVVFMTQDAEPAAAGSLAALLAPFERPSVGVTYGRQLPRPGAGPIEAHARLFNYRQESAEVSADNAAAYGIKATFCSNSFAAYRQTALTSIGGFPERVIFGEDAVAAARMLLAGWSKVYVADAVVHHSHGYTMVQEFRRCFDIGALHAMEAWLPAAFGGASSEGLRFLVSELRYLLRTSPGLIPEAIARNVVKYATYRVGRSHPLLPPDLRARLSMNRRFWVSDEKKSETSVLP